MVETAHSHSLTGCSSPHRFIHKTRFAAWFLHHFNGSRTEEGFGDKAKICINGPASTVKGLQREEGGESTAGILKLPLPLHSHDLRSWSLTWLISLVPAKEPIVMEDAVGDENFLCLRRCKKKQRDARKFYWEPRTRKDPPLDQGWFQGYFEALNLVTLPWKDIIVRIWLIPWIYILYHFSRYHQI